MSSSSSPPVRPDEHFLSSLGGDLFGGHYDDLDDVDVDAAPSTAKQPVRFSSPSRSPVQRPTIGNKGVPRTAPPTKTVVPEERVSKDESELFRFIIGVLVKAGERVVMKNFWDIMRHVFDLCRPTENAAVKDSKGVRMVVINNVVPNLTELKAQLISSQTESPFMAWLGEVVRLLPPQHRETARNMCTVEAFTKKKKPGGPKSSAKSPKPREEEEKGDSSSDDDDDDDDDDDSSGGEELVSESAMAKPKPAPIPPPKVAVSKKRPAEAPPADVPPPPQKVQRNTSSSSSSSSDDDWYQNLFDEIGSKFKAMKQTVSALEQENHDLKHGAGPLVAENKKLAAEIHTLKAKNKKLNAMIKAFVDSEENTD
jgi:hypothetical protein